MPTAEKLFQDDEYCREQLCIARDLFCNKNTTEIQYEEMERCLAYMFLFCNENMKDLVRGTLLESQMRKLYFLSI